MNIQFSNPSEASAAIKRKALELGFSQAGIVPAEPLAEEEARLREWLARGFHGEMKWMERDPSQRADPRRIFPDARSVLVVTMNYYTADEHHDSAHRRLDVATASGNDRVNAPATGKVSRYAWGDDYHDVVGEKLRELLSWIKQQWPEANGKVCVDIQPMMDKAWAARAGLGWIGKHSNLITRAHGSWVFIGELILNLDLACNELEIDDQCGSCTLCLEACPTSAIVEPYVIDANRCISHATIESRAAQIPPEVVEHLEGWFYGCDICQDVCPWNQMTPATNEVRFEPRQNNVNTTLSEILELAPNAYATRFRRSAMKRAKLAGLQRNARTLLKASEHPRVPKAPY